MDKRRWFAINDIKTRLDKANRLKQENIKEFDKYLFNYCSLKAKSNIDKANIGLTAFWNIAVNVIVHIDDSNIFEASTIQKFLDGLENTTKNMKYDSIEYLYLILFELIQEYTERKIKQWLNLKWIM